MRGSRLRRRVDRVVPLVSAIPYAVPDMAVCVSAAGRAIPGTAPAAFLNKDVDLATAVHNSLMVGSSLIVITRRTSSRIVTRRTQILAVRVAQRQQQDKNRKDGVLHEGSNYAATYLRIFRFS